MANASPLGDRKPPAGDIFWAAMFGDQEWMRCCLKRGQSACQTNKQGLTVLHVSAQHGQIDCMKLLVESCGVDVNSSCPHGQRPLHMVLSPQSRPNSHTCLMYLLQHGAQHNVSTDEGLTPLHMAAAEGLKECVETLVAVGADINACENRGHTALDLARIWGHRVIARFLKHAMWHKDKQKDAEGHKALQNLKQNLICMHNIFDGKEKVAREAINKHKVSDWAGKKGVLLCWPPLKGSHTLSHSCRSTGPPKTKSEKWHPSAPREMWNISTNPSKPPPATVSRPQGVRLGIHPEKAAPQPDLRKSVKLERSEYGRLHYTAAWQDAPQPVPDLPLDVIQKSLFPLDFPSCTACPLSSVLDLPHLGCTAGPGTSPWTEVAMHLAEKLLLGHY